MVACLPPWRRHVLEAQLLHGSPCGPACLAHPCLSSLAFLLMPTSTHPPLPPPTHPPRCASTHSPRGCSSPRTPALQRRCAATACPPSSPAWHGTRTRPGPSRVRAAGGLLREAVPAQDGAHSGGGGDVLLPSRSRPPPPHCTALPSPQQASLVLAALTAGPIPSLAPLWALRAVADYDGVVSQVDMESGHLIAEADEHGGRRWALGRRARTLPACIGKGGMAACQCFRAARCSHMRTAAA